MSAYRKPSLKRRYAPHNAWRLRTTAPKGSRNSASRLVTLVGGPWDGGTARLSYGVNETAPLRAGELVGVYFLNEPYQVPFEKRERGGRLPAASRFRSQRPVATWKVIS